MKIIKVLGILLLCMLSTLTLAVHRDQRSAANGLREAPAKLGGPYIGLGVGQNALRANRSSVTVGGYQSAAYQSTNYDYFPAVQLGFWKNLSPRWLWGMKTFYKYLDASANYTISNGEQNNNEDVTVPHEFAAVLTFARRIKKITPYVGVGVIWLPKVLDVFHDYDSPVVVGLGHSLAGYDYSTQKSLIGGIFQLGFLCNLNPKWFIDAVYSYGFTGKSSYRQTIDSLSFNRSIRVTVQELMLSLNWRFML